MATSNALGALAELLRSDETLISDYVVDPQADPALGRLVAAGPRANGSEDDYALVVEAVREGYLLHYGSPRILRGVDADLAARGRGRRPSPPRRARRRRPARRGSSG